MAGADLDLQLEFYINGVAILVVASLGICGNILSLLLFTFRRLRMNPTFTGLLIWLAILDSLFLVCVVAIFSLPTLSASYKTWVLPLLLPSLLPVTSIMLTASVYTVVCLSLERLLHLCRPHWSNKGAFIGYILPVLVFSTCYNFPKFLEFTTIHHPNRPPIARATDFRKNSDYSLYVLSINCLMMGVVPFTLLIGMNISILRHFTSSLSSQERRETAMRALLFSIVGVQLVCHAPRTGLNIFEMSKAFSSSRISLDEPWVIDVSHLLLVVSASCNVVIFIAQDVRFRNLLVVDLKRLLQLYQGNSERIPPTEGAQCSLPSISRINKYPAPQFREAEVPEPLLPTRDPPQNV